MKPYPIHSKNLVGQRCILLLLLLLLAACGGSVDEAVEDIADSDTSDVTDINDSETIEDSNVNATGSEEDSGELPPTPEPGSKVGATRITTEASGSELIAANGTPVNRGEAANTAVSRPLDLLFLVDTTGSMTNELNALQAALPDLVDHLTTLFARENLHLGLVTYGDQGKQAPVQMFEFTDDSRLFTETLASLTAVGGGDYPEDLNEGLYQAVTGMAWRSEANKLLILFGDAPPQAATDPARSFVPASLLAAEQGIRLVVIGSDGLDAAGEAIFQQIAQTGNGRFYLISDNPENSSSATAVYAPAHLPTLLTEIVEEVLNEQAP